MADVALDQRTAHKASAHAAFGVRSAVNIPILEGGSYVAMFFVLSSAPRDWSPSEVTFICKPACT